MKKKFILIPLIGALLYLSLSSYYYGPAYSGLGDRTGATGGTMGCGSGCHSSSATSLSAVTIQLLSGSTPITAYVPGTTYTLKITATNNNSSTLPNFGFQALIVKSSGAGTSSAISTGTFGSAPGSTHTQTVGSVVIFEHYNASFGDGSIAAATGSGSTGSTYTESISWTAPSAGTGSVVLYGVANLVNHNSGADAGDLWNTATPVTICEQLPAITGTLSVCAGATTTLSDASSGGTWSSASPSVGTINTSGVVTGISGGTTVISYGSGCTAGAVATTVTVNAVTPGNFVSGSGPAVVCAGSTITLGNINPVGTWSSASTGIATVTSGGVVTGVSAGTAVISYFVPSIGCAATTTVTVNALPTISGTLSICPGTTTTLSATPAGGTWVSSNPSMASVGSASGIVTGAISGNPVITYTSPGGCVRTATITVNALPSAITGTLMLCQGATTPLANATTGGNWSSVSTGIATIGTSGIVSGVAGGTSTISYTLPSTGCAAIAVVTVNPAPFPISPSSFAICPGATQPLSESTTGGTWSSAGTGIASVGTSGTVTGIATGSTTISYTLTGTGCYTTAAATVYPLPSPITGTLSVCVGSTDTLHDATTGGSWTSGSTTFATIDLSTGIVSGISGPGTSVITYTDLSTFCTTTSVVTVNPLPTMGSIGSSLNVCPGTCTSLNCTPAGGTWASLITSVATIGSSSGIACGITGGATSTVVYSYTDVNGCSNTASNIVTVNPAPSAISGSSAVCVGSATAYTDGSSGGSWSSSNTSVASVGSTGLVTGIATGSAIISYTALGCSVTKTITVNPIVSVITGPSIVCPGTTITLTDTIPGGTWSSGSTGIATIGSTSGIVTGVTSGIVVITYSSGAGCFRTKTITVNPLPAAIGGGSAVCVGSSISLTDGTPGGTWSSSATGTASVGSTGVVTGVSAGTATISYTVSTTGCYATKPITVNPLPIIAPITGTTNVCVGLTSALGDATPGGTWATSNPAVASVGSSSGIVTGVSGGTAVITYTAANGFGCSAFVTTAVTVNPVPSTIGGATSVCTGISITLTESTPGGSWSSSSPNATVGSTGSVTGVIAGTAVISYTLPTGCYTIITITVNPSPGAITGAASVCSGQSTTLTNSSPGGTWTTSSGSLATVGSSSGVVTGVAPGTPIITYTLPGGCFVTKVETVNALSPISGPSSSCAGAATTLTDATGGGTWSSSNTVVATIGSSSGVVTAIATGSTTISYTLPSGCVATITFSVISSPAPISGSTHVCIGSTTGLTETGGGTWTSSSTSVATIGSTGIVTGVTAGIATITYSLGTGCTTTLPFTVNPLPSVITGAGTVCPGATTSWSDATTGGTWSTISTSASVGSSSGLVTGITSGLATITYTSLLGCNVTRVVTVNAGVATISGTSIVCVGSTSSLTDATPGGSWTSGATGIATISSSGVLSGVSAGTGSITYTIGSTGCYASTPFTVNPLPASITGTLSVCVGATSLLDDATTGGTWTASGSSATIGSSSGLVTGASTGLSTISYTLPTGCRKTASVTVNALPIVAVFSGPLNVCSGSTATLIDATPGGTWSSSDITIVSVGSSSGVITGVTVGSATITYTVTSSAGCTSFVTAAITVNPAPSPITGTATMCEGSTTALADATSGGAWSSSPTTIATVGSTGIVTGVAAGTAIITYTATSGCTVTYGVTVNPMPSAIGGTTHVCAGSTTTLTDVITGGTWTSGTITIATVGSASGILSGVLAGNDTITYTLPTGCSITVPITVNPLPVSGTITGPSSVCAGAAISLADATTGGVWSSSNTTLATVGSAGLVTGVIAGIDTIKYTVTNICGASVAMQVITINPLPVAGTITGATLICIGTPDTLTDAAPGGSWSSSDITVATVGSASGFVTGTGTGSATITYTVTNICSTATATLAVTVSTLPSVDAITGIDSVCEGDTIALSDATPGGSWSADNSNATVGATGTITGVTAGTTTISYSVTNACGTNAATLLVTIRSHVVCNVGIKPLPSSPDFRVYPNPSSGSFTVEIPETVNGSVITIDDVLGKTIETRVIEGTNAQKTVFTLNIAAGTYFVSVHAGNRIFRAKLVIW